MKFLRCFFVLLALAVVFFIVNESFLASCEKENETVSSAASDSYLEIDGIKGKIPVKGLSWGDKAPTLGRYEAGPPTVVVGNNFNVIIEKGAYSQKLSEAVKSRTKYALGTLVVGHDTWNEYALFEIIPKSIKPSSSGRGLEEVSFNFHKCELK
jgi:hypothetical protein